MDKAEVDTKDIFIGPGASQKVAFTTKLESSGPHTIEIGESSKEVNVIKKAEIKAQTINVTPALVFTGQEATVNVAVTTTGDVAGNFPVTMFINDIETDSQMVSLEPAKPPKLSLR